MNQTHGAPEIAVAKIGRNGAKLHPVIRFAGEREWFFQCSCPATRNGSAAHSMQVFRGVRKQTCGR